jgi:preprotein translocase subunit SecE
VKDLVPLLIWVIVIGGIFAYLWWKGHLMQLSNYVQETKDELRKCTWPSVEELKGSTVVVMVMMILLGFFTFVVDLAFHVIVRAVI